MTDPEYRVFLDMLMCADPWPLDERAHNIAEDLANRLAEARGYVDWVEAFHELKVM